MASPSAHPTSPRVIQLGLDELGTPLSEVTFVVVDLETTGASAKESHITEIGAVKVRGGEVLGEYQTLVDPGYPVPAFIARLTGITTEMLADAPPIHAVLPSFVEFARGSVLVAHNAPFDVSFLRAAYRDASIEWPKYAVVDTVALARRVVSRDEAPNHKLSTLARLFQATVTPEHRALADARATVDVMHALFARLGPLGITHLEDLATAADPVPPQVRRKRHLADGLPQGPGVYMFLGPRREVLYVGTSVSIRTRVRSYFTAAEKRTRMAEMVRLAESVVPVPCATALEARVRELRLIAEYAPRYNRRSTHPERMAWVRLTDEPFPRLSIVREVTKTGTHIGPFASHRQAQASIEAIQETIALRQCTRRLPRVAAPAATACLLADMGRCGAPCIRPDPGYVDIAQAAREAMSADPSPVVDKLSARIGALCAREEFELAGEWAHRLRAFLAGAARAQRMGPLAACSQLVAARPEDRGWEIVVIRYGRLAATGACGPGEDPWTLVGSLIATAEEVTEPIAPAPAAHPHETEILLDWLESPGTRLVDVTDPLTCPPLSARQFLTLAEASDQIAARQTSTTLSP